MHVAHDGIQEIVSQECVTGKKAILLWDCNAAVWCTYNGQQHVLLRHGSEIFNGVEGGTGDCLSILQQAADNCLQKLLQSVAGLFYRLARCEGACSSTAFAGISLKSSSTRLQQSQLAIMHPYMLRSYTRRELSHWR